MQDFVNFINAHLDDVYLIGYHTAESEILKPVTAGLFKCYVVTNKSVNTSDLAIKNGDGVFKVIGNSDKIIKNPTNCIALSAIISSKNKAIDKHPIVFTTSGTNIEFHCNTEENQVKITNTLLDLAKS